MSGSVSAVVMAALMFLSGCDKIGKRLVTVSFQGDGRGMVSIADRDGWGKTCKSPAPCSVRVSVESQIGFSAQPETGSQFAGWQGDCKDFRKTSTCNWIVGRPMHVVAVFRKMKTH